MIRNLFFFLLLAGGVIRASEPIPAPAVGGSAVVAQPHVTAELIPDFGAAIQAGRPFEVALHLHMDPGWHTYWVNPGDAGLATDIKWTLPPGFTAGPIQWPTPEKHNMGPLVTYGYGGDVYLLTTITPPVARDKWPLDVEIKARATWLVCQDECIPGKADLSFRLEGGMSPAARAEDAVREKFFAEARARMPAENTRWAVMAFYGKRDGTSAIPASPSLILELSELSGHQVEGRGLRFFPEQQNVLSNAETGQGGALPSPPGMVDLILNISLIPDGEKPAKLSGVLISDDPLIGDAKSVYLSEFPVKSPVTPASVAMAPSDSSSPGGGAGDGHRPPLQAAAVLAPAAQPLLLAVLGAAFIGGLILNLMPCVLPVLSLKVFSLMRHAGDDPRGAWKQGAAFTAGVVVSFWALAGLLLILRAAGNQLGWGFQMQSPGFVTGLIFLFFLLGLNLFGVFELGASLVGLDAKATGKFHGLTSSFLNGALATAAATPCTAPFMGSSLGFAAQQPPQIALLIFTALALGMASPYLLLTLFPGALKFVPKPGAWMESFKQFMGFLLMGTVIFLLSVFGALVGQEQVYQLLFGLLVAAIGVWLFGGCQRASSTRWVSLTASLLLLVSGIFFGGSAAMAPMESPGASSPSARNDGYQPWSQTAVDQALAQGRPVFVDFTAAWCLSCKVNERVALETDAVRQAFAAKNVLLLKADWTHSDSEISKALQKYNRDGVPLYLLYSPKAKEAPQVLPEVLTPGIVLDALNQI